MDKNLLDENIDWENEGQPEAPLFYTNDAPEVVMIRTFNNEEIAHLYATHLKNSNIDAQVVSASGGQMTPFAYANHRLYVAESQALEAKQILNEIDVENNIVDGSSLKASHIFLIVFIGMILMSVIIALVKTLLWGSPF